MMSATSYSCVCRLYHYESHNRRYFAGRQVAVEYLHGGFFVLPQACPACSGALAALQPAAYSRVRAERVRTGRFVHPVGREQATGGGSGVAGGLAAGQCSPFSSARPCSRAHALTRVVCTQVALEVGQRRQRRGDCVGRSVAPAAGSWRRRG